ncbi:MULTISPECIES: response regulator transcription factor [Bacillaceae]|uniref:response regulator transcription factor n=1 Tax=Bacillaceae TaxID=186817 RepID=UPI00296538A0|nr:response regulator [Bacillus infantis]MDW2879478.1 response regulator [Bacillus infantis]
MKVLIVDDERHVRAVLRKLGRWEQFGVTSILEASNGKEALRILKDEEPDIIFTDIKMPRMSGIELIEQINRISFLGKIILVTGYNDYAYMRKAIQLNSFDYLLKPVDADALESVMQRAADALKKERVKEAESDEFLEEARRLRADQWITEICTGREQNAELLLPFLPAEEADLTLLSFYQMHAPASYIPALAKELESRKIGSAFTFLGEENLCIAVTVKGHWQEAEGWISEHIPLPIRLVQETLDGVDSLAETFQRLYSQLDKKEYRNIRRLDELAAENRIQEIISYVEQYYMEDISLEKLSKLFFLTREHISRKFKKETGVTLSRFVADLRIRQAKSWLIESEESIFSIATMLGYQDEKYFSKLFKKETGLTPFEYRTSRKEAEARE